MIFGDPERLWSVQQIMNAIYDDTTGSLKLSGTITGNLIITGDLTSDNVYSSHIYGGTASGDDLTISSTAHATKGKIFFGANSAYDESINALGIGTTNPYYNFDLYKQQAGTGVTTFRSTNKDTTANVSHNSLWTTQQYGSGLARTLFYAASNRTDGFGGRFDVINENGSKFLFSTAYTFGYGAYFSLINEAGSSGVFLSSYDTSWINGGNLGIKTTTPNSTIQVVGSLSLSYIAKTADYTLTATDYTVDCTANSFTIMLPTAVGCTGRIYNIVNSGTGTITIDGNGSQTIMGELVQYVTPGANKQIQSTGANWIIL